jgi:hypothetical protein
VSTDAAVAPSVAAAPAPNVAPPNVAPLPNPPTVKPKSHKPPPAPTGPTQHHLEIDKNSPFQ